MSQATLHYNDVLQTDGFKPLAVTAAGEMPIKSTAMEGKLDTLNSKDLATQATLALLKTRNDLLATEATAASILAKIIPSPATEASLALLKTRGDLLGTETTLAALKTRNDLLGTEATMAAMKAAIDTLNAKVDLVKTAVDQARAGTTVSLGTDKTIAVSAPVTGLVTVLGTAIKANVTGTNKAGRTGLMIRNPHPSITVRIGPSNVSDTSGFPIGPEGIWTEEIDPATNVDYWLVSTAGAVSVEVYER